jgi:outer membrane biosynthesis protein TonB
MKSSLAILFLFLCLNVRAQTDSTYTNPEYLYGGEKGLHDFIRKNLYIPESMCGGYTGNYIVEFTIDEYGETADVKLLKANTAAIAVKLYKLIPQLKFKPATRNGNPVCVVYTLPITISRQ